MKKISATSGKKLVKTISPYLLQGTDLGLSVIVLKAVFFGYVLECSHSLDRLIEPPVTNAQPKIGVAYQIAMFQITLDEFGQRLDRFLIPAFRYQILNRLLVDCDI